MLSQVFRIIKIFNIYFSNNFEFRIYIFRIVKYWNYSKFLSNTKRDFLSGLTLQCATIRIFGSLLTWKCGRKLWEHIIRVWIRKYNYYPNDFYKNLYFFTGNNFAIKYRYGKISIYEYDLVFQKRLRLFNDWILRKISITVAIACFTYLAQIM